MKQWQYRRVGRKIPCVGGKLRSRGLISFPLSLPIVSSQEAEVPAEKCSYVHAVNCKIGGLAPNETLVGS